MIGVICRMDNTGLGIQSKEFFNHVPCKALVIDSSNFKNNIKQHPEWYPGQTFFRPDISLKIPEGVINEFLKDVTTLITFETPYDYSIFTICKRKRIKTVLQFNYEFLDYPSMHPYPDIFAAPSLWNIHNVPAERVLLPVPVNTSVFKFDRKPGMFVHVVGKPAVNDRNGTYVFLNALRYVKKPISVFIHCWEALRLPKIPPYIGLVVIKEVSKNYHDNYTGGVLVMPRKFGGLSLPVNEALAAEMPVIMTDISPNNTWLPREWLVPARLEGSFFSKQHIDIFEADLHALAAKIDEFADEEFYDAAVIKARELKREISWENMLPIYIDLLS